MILVGRIVVCDRWYLWYGCGRVRVDFLGVKHGDALVGSRIPFEMVFRLESVEGGNFST